MKPILLVPLPQTETALKKQHFSVFFKFTHIVEDVHPPLHGDALENGENSEEDIVKVGDAKAGPDPVLLTGGAIDAGSCWSLQATGEICCLLAYRNKHTVICIHTPSHTQKHTNMLRYL